MSLPLPIPRTEAELTVEWLAAALAEAGVPAPKIESIAVEPLADSVTSVTARIRIEYAGDPAGAPPSLAWERSAQEDDRRAAFATGYEREVRCYRDLAAASGSASLAVSARSLTRRRGTMCSSSKTWRRSWPATCGMG
ncbi:MAG: hypothetical protein DWG74_02695 [Chloroflexi bacterium]|nr:hypothetical protein [Chloroflexota bacterium]